jgi:hypothetical protein
VTGIDPTTVALRQTLEQFGMRLPSPQAQHSLGRLAGLQLASHLGNREARRALTRERMWLLRCCINVIELLEKRTEADDED